MKGDIMKAKKYWIVGAVLAILCVVGLWVEAATRNRGKNQWEYGRYFTIYQQLESNLGGSAGSFAWTDASSSKQVFTKDDETASDLWRKVGFDFGKRDYKEVSITDWFNWLGKQGWELVCIEEIEEQEDSQTHAEARNYWFKRPK